jgi:putative aldouronate transport system permease protein
MTATIPVTAAGAGSGPGPKRNPNRPAWEEKPSLLGQAGKGLSLFVTLAVILFPLWAVVITSFSTSESINRAGGLVLLPHGLTLDSYSNMLSGGVVTRALVIGLLLTLIGTVISIVVSALCAYGLSQRGSFGHRTILMILIITMFFSGGLIPTFLVVSNLFRGYDQYWSLILPSAVSVFNILIMRAFYMGTATDLIDAAKIDGAGDWRILWSIVLPTSKSVTAVMALFYGVSYWNNWFNVLLYMPADSRKWPIQYVLYQYVTQGTQMPGVGTNMAGAAVAKMQVAPLSLQMAMLVLTLIPILVIYPFVQKHFTKGVLLGAIKG